MKPGKKFKGHFGRFRALVEGGWLKVLTRREQSMWLAYEKFADDDGVAYPDGETIAKLIGNSGKSHIGTVRQSLVRRGLLEVLDIGGGRGNPCKVRLLDPVKVPVLDLLKVPATGNLSADKGSRFAPVKVPVLDQKGSRFSGALNKEELAIELPRELASSAHAARAVEKPGANGTAEPTMPKAAAKFLPGVWKRATDGIVRSYTHAHGAEPIFNPRGWKCWAEVLAALKGDLAQLAAVVRAALREKEIGRWRGHPPWLVLEELNYLRSQIAKGQVGHDASDRKSNAEDRGEYAEPGLTIRTIVSGTKTGTA